MGENADRKNIPQTLEPELYIYQTDILGTILLRTLTSTTPIRAVGFYFRKDTSRTAVITKYHTLLLKPNRHGGVLLNEWTNS